MVHTTQKSIFSIPTEGAIGTGRKTFDIPDSLDMVGVFQDRRRFGPDDRGSEKRKERAGVSDPRKSSNEAN